MPVAAVEQDRLRTLISDTPESYRLNDEVDRSVVRNLATELAIVRRTILAAPPLGEDGMDQLECEMNELEERLLAYTIETSGGFAQWLVVLVDDAEPMRSSDTDTMLRVIRPVVVENPR